LHEYFLTKHDWLKFFTKPDTKKLHIIIHFFQDIHFHVKLGNMHETKKTGRETFVQLKSE